MTQHDRLLDLLASRVTEGLDDAEVRELERLIAEQDEIGLDELDEAAAAADLAFNAAASKLESLPADLRQRILADAAAHLPAAVPDHAERFRADRAPGRNPFAVRYLGWYAAAAMLLLSLWAPWATAPEAPALAPTAAAQRAALLAEAPDVIRVDWSPPQLEAYAGVRGDVVWSPGQQVGFMRLVGLPANRPDERQYQLWIVDPSRDEHPIDGGVFDIAAGTGEAIVPIDAKLTVDQVAAFAITLEKPGGVVVSAGPLLVVAPVT